MLLHTLRTSKGDSSTSCNLLPNYISEGRRECVQDIRHWHCKLDHVPGTGLVLVVLKPLPLSQVHNCCCHSIEGFTKVQRMWW